MEYELIREIINPCAGNKRPDVSVDEIEADDLDAYVRDVWGGGTRYEKTVNASGAIVYEQNTDGIINRLTFTP
ncbi:MAG: hypothetical protein LBK61_10310 [Spirochaetaceae bacterium]|nr:hypothetical protein [Spirochaetaceae bacterium]